MKVRSYDYNNEEEPVRKKKKKKRMKYRPKPSELAFWGARKLECLERDNFQCVMCGERACDADHIEPLRMGGSRYDESNSKNNLSNLRSLCRPCHYDVTFGTVNGKMQY